MTALPPPPVRLNRRQRLLGSVLLRIPSDSPLYPIDMTTWLPYGPAGMMAKVTDAVGIRGAFEGFLLEEDGVVDRLIPPSPRLTLGAAATSPSGSSARPDATTLADGRRIRGSPSSSDG